MTIKSSAKLSIVVPIYNEGAGLLAFHKSLTAILKQLKAYETEIIYCNDGSNDDSLSLLQGLAKKDERVRIISLSRNFGKEVATAAGIRHAKGAATVTIDADGQHPVELLPELVKHWENGSKVVVGLRTSNQNIGWIKHFGSRLFYSIFNRLTSLHLIPNATDYRLIDSAVRLDFIRLTEHNRINRGLIDWLGYERQYVAFKAKPRLHGSAGYSTQKLFKLAMDSVISMSNSPLHITAYVGAFILPLSVLLGLVMVIDKFLGDPFNWQATGGAYLSVLVLFLIGIILMSQGIIGLYLSHIHNETKDRPLYIIDNEASTRL